MKTRTLAVLIVITIFSLGLTYAHNKHDKKDAKKAGKSCCAEKSTLKGSAENENTNSSSHPSAANTSDKASKAKDASHACCEAETASMNEKNEKMDCCKEHDKVNETKEKSPDKLKGTK